MLHTPTPTSRWSHQSSAKPGDANSYSGYPQQHQLHRHTNQHASHTSCSDIYTNSNDSNSATIPATTATMAAKLPTPLHRYTSPASITAARSTINCMPAGSDSRSNASEPGNKRATVTVTMTAALATIDSYPSRYCSCDCFCCNCTTIPGVQEKGPRLQLEPAPPATWRCCIRGSAC